MIPENQLSEKPETYFAPAGRDSLDELRRRADVVRATPLLMQTIDALGEAVVILNERRQVVAANQIALGLFSRSLDQTIGQRPGELLGCQHVAEGPDGCGTSLNCSVCGAVDALLKSQSTHDRVTRECRIVLEEPVGGALDLLVHATTVLVDGQRYTICCLKDVSDQKRLAVLTRMFFHDMLNTAGGIRGWTELLREQAPVDSEQERELSDLQLLADQMVEEIQSQRDLVYAESGDLEPEFAPLRVAEFLPRLLELYARHSIAHGRRLVSGEVWQGSLLTDARLLGRVLGNMIKNALEATPIGGTVTVSCTNGDSRHVVFTVHNPGVMPQEVQLQVFQRSFSTKASSGRGIGTHSMKLLGERYLGGQVTFVSSEPGGTTFTITLPKVTLAVPH